MTPNQADDLTVAVLTRLLNRRAGMRERDPKPTPKPKAVEQQPVVREAKPCPWLAPAEPNDAAAEAQRLAEAAAWQSAYRKLFPKQVAYP